MNCEKLLNVTGLSDEQVVNIYPYGSSKFIMHESAFNHDVERVYGTDTPESDWDFTIVVQDETTFPAARVVEGDIDVNIYTVTQFKDLVIDGTKFQILENIFLPKDLVWKLTMDFTPYFANDLLRLRTAVSSITSKGIAYAQICWVKNGERKKAKKNIVHCIRNTMFGMQLAKHGKIIDYSCGKAIFEQIFADTSEDWEHYKQVYGTMAHTLHKEFLTLVPEKPLSDHRRAKRQEWKEERRRAARERRERAAENRRTQHNAVASALTDVDSEDAPPDAVSDTEL